MPLLPSKIASEPTSVQTIPPPPPLPPLASRTVRPSTQGEAEFTVENQAKQVAGLAEAPFEPCFFFFYGSLMDPEVLQTILKLPEAPVALEGSVTGFAVKMWGIYPTLIPCAGGKVLGRAWRVNERSQFLRLQAYETSAYTWCTCDIQLVSGEAVSGCRTFCWAGDPRSKELEEGTFDLERYQRYFKSSVVRGRPIQDY
jgi:gamma-glutamylcyclotransferase (GGCT)/AIG2-like uncharacterized protein YtfP